jgi:Rps23 Pro-64 3,4-dihydroxylase Tpa1-like proline 4-hydroxylase
MGAPTLIDSRIDSSSGSESSDSRVRGEWIRPFSFSCSELERVAESLRRDYETAEPFPHVVIDDLLPIDVLEGLHAEFPDPDHPEWQLHDDPRQQKLQGHRRELHGPFTRQVLGELMGRDFLAFLEDVTGVRGLVTDPSLVYGGLHQILPGGHLQIHVDVTFEPRLHLERRLNLILYLNPRWEEGWAGELELWDPTAEVCVVRVQPKWGRMVLFSATPTAYHGHPRPLACPADVSRRSLALYYYTVPTGRMLARTRWVASENRIELTRHYIAEMLPKAFVAKATRIWEDRHS